MNSKRRGIVIVVNLLVGALLVGRFGTSSAQDHHGAVHGNLEDRPTDSITIKILRDLKKQADALKKRPTQEDRVKIPHQNPGDDFWSGMLQVTQVDNPLISKECRDAAIRTAQETIGGPDKALAHALPHLEEWKNILSGDRTISLSKYLTHMVECKEFCGPLIGGLIKCHIDGMRSCAAIIILFDKGRPQGDGNFHFSPTDVAQIRNFAQRMRLENKAILLEARASNLNARESLPYNESLAMRRADAMVTALIEAGFPAKDIVIKILCWEPPRLAIRDIAAAYRFEDLWSRQPNPQYLDQSVVLLGYNKRMPS